MALGRGCCCLLPGVLDERAVAPSGTLGAMRPSASGFPRLVRGLPNGSSLEHTEWARRHRGVLVLLLLHVPALAVFGVVQGQGPGHSLWESAILLLFAAGASFSRLPHRLRTVAACTGLITASAMLTHFWGGTIEAHFHFFVMLGVIALYHDWLPFALSVFYVAVHHGVAGAVDPGSVYNHPVAMQAPFLWAGIHAFFVAGLSSALIVLWGLGEKAVRERDAALQENREHLAMLSSTVDSTADGMLVVDMKGQIRLFNRRFQQMWRIPDEILRERDDEAAIAHVLGQLKDPEAFLRKVKGLYDEPNTESFDVLEFKDGRVFERFSRPHRVGDETIGRVWSFHDATDRRRAEKARMKNLSQMKEIEHLRKIQDFRARFVNTAAHELNTPLTPIRIQMHMLEGRLRTHGQDRDLASLAVLKRNFTRFERLVQDLLDVARLESQKLMINRGRVDLGGLLRDVAADHRDSFEAKGLTLDLDAQYVRAVHADPHRITQTLSNLLNNAGRYTPAGGKVTIRARPKPSGVVVCVEDTGAGLTKQQIKRLFLPFSQVSEAQDAKEGTGLGLYICKGIVDLHGGAIWCESDGPGKGSRFSFSLPYDEQRPSHAEKNGAGIHHEAPEGPDATPAITRRG